MNPLPPGRHAAALGARASGSPRTWDRGPRVRLLPALALALVSFVLAAPAARAQGLGLDGWSAGIEAVHDHVSFSFFQPARNDPYLHRVQEGYAFDGPDLIFALCWHWNQSHWLTQLRLTPAARSHWDYDQDTNFLPGGPLAPPGQFTHGDEGYARGRTFALSQRFPAWRPGGRRSRWGSLAYRLGLLRQFTRYHAVTTYNLNSDPALPSMSFSRLIGERAIIYELRNSLLWRKHWSRPGWRWSAMLGVSPLTGVWLRNYIPVVEATSQTQAYGFSAALAATRHFSRSRRWGLRLAATAAEESGYNPRKTFRRQTFALQLQLTAPG